MNTPQHQKADAMRWFATNLQPHERMLRGWLVKQFGGNCDVDDIVQEAFMRVLQVWREDVEMRGPRAFLFQTARNLALTRLRHLAVLKEISLEEFDASSVLDESALIPHSHSTMCAEELEMLAKAIQPKKENEK